MKNFIIPILVFLFSNVIICHAQSTWVRTQNVDNIWPGFHEDSTSVGPLEMVTTPNGTIISLVQVKRDHETWLIAMDSTGKVIWQKIASYYGGIYVEDCYSLHPTLDNGCIYFRQHQSGGTVTDDVYRITAGSNAWSKTYYYPIGSNQIIVNNITQSAYNTTMIQFGDSLVELSSSGAYLQSRVPFSRTAKLFHLPDSDFIYNDSPLIIKENFQGTIRWSISEPGYVVSSANADFIYARSGSQVKKISTLTGAVIWTKPVLSSALVQTSDYGFITIMGNEFAKYDSSGLQQWNKIFSLPHFGLKCLAEIPGKSYVSGGAWCNYNLYYNVDTGYSPIIFSMDSMGNSVVDSVNYFIDGNANDNSILSFADDAVYVAAAMNNAGPARDTLIRSQYLGGISVFATDWSTGFTSGINHKFSDIDGNGFIDSSDVLSMSSVYSKRNASPHWLKQSNPANLPDLKFVFENHNLNYMDTIIVDVIAGSSTVPTDSIYGISFELLLQFINTSGFSIQSFYSANPTAFGDTSQNLFINYSSDPQGIPALSSMVMCRTDHVNTILAGDTIVKLYYLFPPGTTYINPVQIYVEWNAINEAGYPISLNTVTDSIYFSGLSGLNSISENKLKLFPNPANDKMNIVFDDNEEYRIRIFDNLGRLIYESKPEKSYINLDLKNFNDGVYYISAKSENKNLKSRFVIQH